jgi:hypothetical protein
MLVRIDFTFDGVPGAAGAIPSGTAPLNHEIGNDSMKSHTPVESRFCQLHKIGDCLGRIFVEKLDANIAFGRFDDACRHESSLSVHFVCAIPAAGP